MQVAFLSWYENPVITTVDTVSYELTQGEYFPTIIICPKQKKFYADEWGLVKVSFDMIEYVCLERKSENVKCSFYLEKRDALIQKASEMLETGSYITDLSLSHVVIMAATKAEKNETFLHSLYTRIADIFGQTTITPMGLIKVLLRQTGMVFLVRSGL